MKWSAPQTTTNDVPRDERGGDLNPHDTGNTVEKGE
jgi:hypothetical protein